jgi:predicted Zn-dependent protease
MTNVVGTVKMSRRELIAGLAAGTVVACTTNPETGRSQFLLVSNEQLAQLSAGSWNDVKAQEKVSNDPALNAQLRRIGDRITSAAGQRDKNWEYAVFDSDEKNAFVLPGGQVGFYKGIMTMADNDDQIATVLGHEVGHVTGRHAAERYSQQVAAAGGLALASVALASADVENRGTIAAVLGAGVTFGIILPYARKHELEADRLGVDYMARAGYNPRESINFWNKMAAEGGPRQPAFMSTHPHPATRIAELNEHIARMGY